MKKVCVFLSSVQQEFAEERQILAEYIRSDKLLGQFFEPFLFELLPASNHKADALYLDAVRKCEIYLGLFGLHYGFENNEGISPTELEFIEASLAHRNRLVFIRGLDTDRHPKMRKLIALAESQLVRKRFVGISDLKTHVYSAFIEFLMQQGHIQTTPFDAALSSIATMDDIDEQRVRHFITLAKTKRGFPLAVSVPMVEVLTHLNLWREGKPTHAALLLFGKNSQKWFTTSIVKCAYYHGTIIAKPIASHKDLRGDIFELIDQAVDFVLSHLNVSTGVRSVSNDITIHYEIPRAVIVEAIVNAVAHRDYTSNGSVQVMLFADRVEIWNPGFLPPNLTIDQLRRPHASFPANPLLAEPMYQVGYIERMGTGTGDMIRDCVLSGLAEPVFIQEDMFKTILWRKFTPQLTPQVTPQVATGEMAQYKYLQLLENRLLGIMFGEMSRQTMMELLDLKDIKNFRENYLTPAINNGWIERTNPNANSSHQSYKLTRKGKIRQTKLKK